ncbi:hypothetical protein ZWY2020_054842 [Hordeum vulgare]|nr:hypothetical protein ZWY2020_054842 [Hordeum vulgare]
MWTIWGNQNKYTHGETIFQPLRSMEIIQEHIRSLAIPAKQKAIQKRRDIWMTPLEGVVKLNSDAAIDSVGGRSRTGVVAGDHVGTFIGGRYSPYVGLTDPYISEALGCRDAMLLAKERGWPIIEVFSDCKTVVDDWNGGRDRSVCGPIFREMSSYLSSFQGFELIFSGREANEVAHVLASQGLATGMHFVTFDVIPDVLSAVVHSDYVRSLNKEIAYGLYLKKGISMDNCTRLKGDFLNNNSSPVLSLTKPSYSVENRVCSIHGWSSKRRSGDP